MNGIIDFHAHAFPDHIARTAIPYLAKEGKVSPRLDGTVTALLASMDDNNVAQSVVCTIATKPAQFASILAWSKEIRSERIIPFPSFHPADPDCLAQIRRIRAEGFVGVKMHPYYQEFSLDEERMLPIYQALVEQNLILVMHTGYDIAFPRTRIATPEQIVTVTEQFPQLKLVTSHMGAWEMWDEVEQWIIGRPIYMDISFALDQIAPDRARRMLQNHPADYLLFATDSPWFGQGETMELLRGLELGKALEQKILRDNGMALLQSSQRVETA